jgi:hypothetical protein
MSSVISDLLWPAGGTAAAGRVSRATGCHGSVPVGF